MGKQPKVYTAKISDLKTLGDTNPNKGTERGVYAVEKSLEKFGAWRSIAVAQDGQVVAGNHTLEAYAAAGNEDVLVVETDGQQLIVVKRTDIAGDDPRAKEYAVADNRSSELGLEWDTAQLQALLDSEIDLSDFFHDWELDKIIQGLEDESVNYGEHWQDMPEFEQNDIKPFKSLLVHFRNLEDLQKFTQLMDQVVTEKTKSIYYPKQEKMNMKPYRIADES